MLTESHDEEQIIARVAALDIGKAEVVCCVRVPAGANAKKRLQEVSTHSTMTRALTELANHLVDLGVERVVIEKSPATTGGRCATCSRRTGWIRGWLMPATSNICRVDPRAMRWTPLAVQGRRTADAAPEFRAAQTDPAVAGSDPLPHRSGRRPHGGKEPGRKTPRGPCIKLSVVASDIFGVSGRAMMVALIGGSATPGCSRSWRARGCGPRSAC